jgi:PemK-like, MazF-like toxin of type II toxin-antitoxin system
VTLPSPRPGLVICCSYLWADERRRGAEEGGKSRPCAIIAAHRTIENREIVTVLPITHSAPANATAAVEIPPAVKAHLGLDAFPSWVVVTETNDFPWPGPDLRPVPGVKPARFDYGTLPPRFFAHIRDRVLQATEAGVWDATNGIALSRHAAGREIARLPSKACATTAMATSFRPCKARRRREFERPRAIGEQGERDSRGQREAGPGREASKIARAHEADREARLAARRPWQ